MENKKCAECGTENSPDFIYCKNCGSILREPPKPVQKESAGKPETENGKSFPQGETAGQSAPQPETAGQHAPQGAEQSAPFSQPDEGVNFSASGAETEAPQAENRAEAFQSASGSEGYSQPQGGYGAGAYNPYMPYGMGYGVPAVEGVPVEDVAVYVGMKAPSIIPKFVKMEVTRSKTSWCGPVFTLGLLFGPLGAAIWFFYRKMYKAALILLAIGAVLASVGAAVNFDPKDYDYSAKNNSYEDFDDVWEEFNYISSYSVPEAVMGLVNFAVSVATGVLTGIFGMYFYKREAVKKIRLIVNSGYDRRYYKLGLASAGGTSGGMAALGVFLMFAVYLVLEIIKTIIAAGLV